MKRLSLCLSLLPVLACVGKDSDSGGDSSSGELVFDGKPWHVQDDEVVPWDDRVCRHAQGCMRCVLLADDGEGYLFIEESGELETVDLGAWSEVEHLAAEAGYSVGSEAWHVEAVPSWTASEYSGQRTIYLDGEGGDPVGVYAPCHIEEAHRSLARSGISRK